MKTSSIGVQSSTDKDNFLQISPRPCQKHALVEIYKILPSSAALERRLGSQSWVLGRLDLVDEEDYRDGRTLLLRIVSMLSKMLINKVSAASCGT